MLTSRQLLRSSRAINTAYCSPSIFTTNSIRTLSTSTPKSVEAPSLTSPDHNTSTVLNPPPKAAPATTPTPARSSVAAGTILKGLNYYKNKTDPVALEDHEYPEWLWSVLDQKVKSASEGQKVEVDPRLYSKSARARQKANKLAREQAKRNPPPAERPLPIYEQTIDLPTGSAAEAQGGRMDLTKAMRSKRRRDIKEGNFLKSMT